jgi:hypothetical protein
MEDLNKSVAAAGKEGQGERVKWEREMLKIFIERDKEKRGIRSLQSSPKKRIRLSENIYKNDSVKNGENWEGEGWQGFVIVKLI